MVIIQYLSLFENQLFDKIILGDNMNTILQKNMKTLHAMYMEHPDSMRGLTADGNFLVLGDQRVDISSFDISSLMNGVNPFMESLDELAPLDVYKIIRLHALGGSALTGELPGMEKDKKSDEEKLEEIKKENPLMKNITIVNKPTEYGVRQYFNIVDSTGKDNLFFNDMNIDIFGIYEALKLRKGNQDVTPEELIEVVRRKLYDVDLMNTNQSESDKVKEEFRNKMMYQDAIYKGDKSINVYGNQEHDITLINDDRSVEGHQVLTYENNEYGDVVATTHNQNVSGEQVIDGQGTQVSSTTSVAKPEDDKKDTMEVEEDTEKKKEVDLIPIEQFYYILDSGTEMNQDMRNSMDLWYAFLEDLILYEDFLNEDLKEVLKQYRNYVTKLQLAEGVTMNVNQVEACDNYALYEARKQEKQIGQNGFDKANELAYVLTKKKPPLDNAAFVAYAQVIAIIFTVAVLLTAVALYVINFM